MLLDLLLTLRKLVIWLLLLWKPATRACYSWSWHFHSWKATADAPKAGSCSLHVCAFREEGFLLWRALRVIWLPGMKSNHFKTRSVPLLRAYNQRRASYLKIRYSSERIKSDFMSLVSLLFPFYGEEPDLSFVILEDICEVLVFRTYFHLEYFEQFLKYVLIFSSENIWCGELINAWIKKCFLFSSGSYEGIQNLTF